jgi:hypothetical protein
MKSIISTSHVAGIACLYPSTQPLSKFLSQTMEIHSGKSSNYCFLNIYHLNILLPPENSSWKDSGKILGGFWVWANPVFQYFTQQVYKIVKLLLFLLLLPSELFCAHYPPPTHSSPTLNCEWYGKLAISTKAIRSTSATVLSFGWALRVCLMSHKNREI